MEERVSIRHLYLLVLVAIYHAIIPIDPNLKARSNIGPIAKRGCEPCIIERLSHFLRSVEVHSWCIPIKSLTLVLVITRRSKASAGHMTVSKNGIHSLQFAPMEISDPLRFCSIAVPPRTKAFCRKRSFVEVTEREFHPACFVIDG
jgi:hypothetical protein